MSNNCKFKIISFEHINLYILLIPLGAVLTFSAQIIIFYSNKLNNESTNEQHHPVIILINYSFGLCLTFVFFIIYKIYNKSNKKKSVFFLDKMMNKAPSNKEITKKEKFLWILLGSVLDFIANLFFNSDSSEESYYLIFGHPIYY